MTDTRTHEREEKKLNDDHPEVKALKSRRQKLLAEKRHTIVFECGDARKLPNPFQTETPFGKAVTIALGDVCKEYDTLEDICHAFADAVERLGLERQFDEAMRLYDAKFAPSTDP